MSYKIVTDSSCDYTPEMQGWSNLASVPLTLLVGDYQTLDDDAFDQSDFVRRMLAYEGAAKSACPSIDSWMQTYAGEEDEVYVLTITSKLSGSYNSAVQAAEMYREEYGSQKKIHVFDSKSTSAVNAIVAMKIKELADGGMPFEELVPAVTGFIDECFLYFVLDDFSNLRKNGRMSNLQSTVLNALRVKLIMKATDGMIEKLTQEISLKRAMLKMTDVISKQLEGIDTTKEKLIVTHVMNPETAQMVHDKLCAQHQFANSWILEMGGLNTLYANVGSVLVGFSKQQ